MGPLRSPGRAIFWVWDGAAGDRRVRRVAEIGERGSGGEWQRRSGVSGDNGAALTVRVSGLVQTYPMDAPQALLTAAAVHAGFQATITLITYPMLLATPAATWAQVHAGHYGRINPVVALVYGAVIAAWVSVFAGGEVGPALWVAAAGSVITGTTTALWAAPTHRTLRREGPRPELLRRLLRADRVRLLGALLTLAGALIAAP